MNQPIENNRRLSQPKPFDKSRAVSVGSVKCSFYKIEIRRCAVQLCSFMH